MVASGVYRKKLTNDFFGKYHIKNMSFPMTLLENTFMNDILTITIKATIREESSQTNVILQYKLLAAILSAVLV